MAKKFFPDEWEKISAEEMIRARARLSGFIESIPEKDKAIRDVSIKRWKTWCLLEPDGCIFRLMGEGIILLQRIYLTKNLLKGWLFLVGSAWWVKGEFTPENVSHWNFVKGMIIPSRFRLMSEGRFYSREIVSQKFVCVLRNDYS